MAIYNELLSSSQEIINIQIVIDTDAITTDYPNPSKDPANPTGLPHNYMYMVATRSDVITGSGTANLTIKANVGDIIRWHAVSENSNFDSAVVIYNLSQFGGTTVFNNLTFSVYTRQGILPIDCATLPVDFSTQNFWFNQANVINTGTEYYTVQFALYVRQTDFADPVLFGYYYWNPTVTVQN
ncbi:inclusion body family protein [Mucilaginibacter sp. RCC_168]|uniref:inclusion body family protein n=1 Tax=unclassified Mucilaginibacter TaxID=2617802 RepID=UPI0035236D7B